MQKIHLEHISHTNGDGVESGDSLLDQVQCPKDMRGFSDDQLKQLADEVRAETIRSVSKTGGHLGAGLGVVELTTALHAVFETPNDRLIWDVGHQCYPHKILTSRRDRMETIRMEDGLSGFTKRKESEYDPFGAGHSSTSISAALGMAVARDLDGDKTKNVVAVIGDGAMTGGMAYEAMNNAGDMNSKLIVILNDNDMSIAPPVGALSKHLTGLISSRPYIGARDVAKHMTEFLPSPLKAAAARAEETARAALGGGTLFEEMGFYYIGPIDGHDMDQLLTVLRNVRDADRERPVLIHAITKKGKGYAPAETSRDKMHGVARFDVVTGNQQRGAVAAPSYTRVFADSLVKVAERDDKVVGITAAMPSGTGMDVFGHAFPERCFDVGIAEQHGVTFAAGLAAEGYKPFVAIYSTFLQRAYDQIVHDVCIQNLPVKFAIDRAGLVGADGATHAGSFDVAYLTCLPGMVVMAAADENELARMVVTAAEYNDGPIAFRYPRGEGVGVEMDADPKSLEIGKGRIVREGSDVAILSFGTRLQECKKAAGELLSCGIDVTIADARFAKPLDTQMIEELAKSHQAIITIEEGSQGGFGSLVLSYLAENDLLASGLKVRNMTLPDRYQDHAKPDRQYAEAGLDADGVVKMVKSIM